MSVPLVRVDAAELTDNVRSRPGGAGSAWLRASTLAFFARPTPGNVFATPLRASVPFGVPRSCAPACPQESQQPGAQTGHVRASAVGLPSHVREVRGLISVELVPPTSACHTPALGMGRTTLHSVCHSGIYGGGPRIEGAKPSDFMCFGSPTCSRRPKAGALPRVQNFRIFGAGEDRERHGELRLGVPRLSHS